MLHRWNFSRKLQAQSLLACAVTLCLMLLTGAAVADDRDLLRDSAGEPYVFVIFDTSKSMSQTPACTREQALDDMDPFDAMCTTECTLGSECAQICPNLGCEEYDFSSTARPVYEPTIIVDNSSLTPATAWFTGSSTSAYNGTYFHDNNTFFCTEFGFFASECREVTYDPGITTAGDYMIFLWWPEDPQDINTPFGVGDSFAANTQVEITHSGGKTTMAMDQRMEGGQWNPIGTWNLNAGQGQVRIFNENALGFDLAAFDGGSAIADAVGWRPVTIPSCIGSQVYRCQQPICPLGDCYTDLNSDDPRSKFYQAKDALYEVVDQTADVNWGFATFNQDQLRLTWKHWLYRVDTGQVLPELEDPSDASNTAEFVQAGDDMVFGFGANDGWDCVTASLTFDGNVSCGSSNPANISDPWDMKRALRVPKLGMNGDEATDVWYQMDHDANLNFKVTYNPAGTVTNLGANNIAVDYEIFNCPSGTCPTSMSSASCGNGICEASDGENCETCSADCRSRSNRCCGFNSAESNPRSPDGCVGNNDYCQKSGFTCTETPAATVPATPDASGTLNFTLVSSYVAEDNDLTREPMIEGGFFDGQMNISSLNVPALQPAPNQQACWGLDENDGSDLAGRGSDDDSSADAYAGYSLRWPTTTDSRGALFSSGDFLPLDWLNNNRTNILERLAPNTVSATDAPAGQADSPPDFRSAVYFKDILTSGDSSTDPILRLTDEAERPLLASGDTPLGDSLYEFQQWYNPTTGTGFIDEAAVEDTLFGCRDQYVLFLTDGNEECFDFDPDNDPSTDPPGVDPSGFHNPCTIAGELNDDDTVLTYVVGFGITDSDPTDSSNALQCMADEGGTEEPRLPQNREELVDDLTDIFSEITVGNRSFASASIPAIQSSSADKIFLSFFSPLPGESIWPGRIDAFRKPLPLTPENEPDFARSCADITNASDDLQSACHIWEAGIQLCEQAPQPLDAAAGSFQLGDDPATERRVVYGQTPNALVPNSLRLFSEPLLPMSVGDALDPTTEDFLLGLDPELVSEWNAGNLTVADLENVFQDLFEGTLGIKTIDPAFVDEIEGCAITDGSGGTEGYVLGDVFHANPVSLASPGNFTYFANNIFGYRDFTRKHAWRRKMLAAATNDGQLHFFDSGVRKNPLNDTTPDANDRIELFTDGSGHELFSYIPRMVLPILYEQAGGSNHVFSMDGTVSTADVYIDPVDDASDDTQWRTVLVGGLREGGDKLGVTPNLSNFETDVSNFKSGYYALDITQPDVINPRLDGTDPTYVPCPDSNRTCNDLTVSFPDEWVPSCLDFTTSATGDQTLPTGCDFPFPMELWTFQDTVEVPGSSETWYLDEDRNDIPDLGETWSRAVIGQILVCAPGGSACDPDDEANDDDLETRQVAIFGGGMDAVRKGLSDVAGNYLYMVDVETGQAIYKRQLQGSAAADPAVLDTDRDGYFDRIYIATTDGLLYKVDLTARSAGLVPGFAAAPSAFTVNELDLMSLDSDGVATRYTVNPGGTISPAIELERITDTAWDPFVILDSGGPYESPTRRGSPFYHAPAAFFIPELNQYGLAIGTGDREDLWSENNGEDIAAGATPRGGRFFVFVDEDFQNNSSLYNSSLECDTRLPVTEECLENIQFDVDPLSQLQANFLLAPDLDPASTTGTNLRRGWAMSFTSDARISAEAFLVAGVLVFPAFDPFIVTNPTGNTCAQSGTTRAFVVSASNAAPVAPLGPDDSGVGGSTEPKGERAIDRYQEISEFTTAPFIDRTATKNPTPTDGEKTLLDEIDDEVSDAVRNALIDQFPRGSRFNEAFQLVIAALKNSTGVSVYTTIPIGIYPADWRDQ